MFSGDDRLLLHISFADAGADKVASLSEVLALVVEGGGGAVGGKEATMVSKAEGAMSVRDASSCNGS